jgi:hypothetical protein
MTCLALGLTADFVNPVQPVEAIRAGLRGHFGADSTFSEISP